MSTIQIIFNSAALAGIKQRSAEQGNPHPEGFIGPEFKDAFIGQCAIQGMVAITVPDEEKMYLYNTSEISRIRITEETETKTASGLVVVRKPSVIPGQ